jgi:murein DD-endopeptidase MepM/ murein hydrolase activator NlpD
MVFESLSDERGNIIRRGDVLYASLNGKAVDKGFYRFTTPDEGVTDYFQGNGESATRFLMKTPINGARLSSSFGRRRHPISGYSRLHKGTDFAAPSGTPIYAAGHGTVERASRYGGYGKYVRVRHANGYKTAYAHMSRYGPGVKSGRRIRQGDIVGYVGSTGASTGPHLHYEVYINGKPVNAMALKLPTGRKLANTPEIMTAFEARRDEIDLFREIENGGDLMITAANSPAP